MSMLARPQAATFIVPGLGVDFGRFGERPARGGSHGEDGLKDSELKGGSLSADPRFGACSQRAF